MTANASGFSSALVALAERGYEFEAGGEPFVDEDESA